MRLMKKILPVIFSFLLSIFSFPSLASAAATFTLSPATQTVKVGDTLTVTIKFDTGGETVSSTKALLSFPPSLLTVDTASGIPDKPTVITKWNQRLYSNVSGTITLNGNTNVTGADQTLAIVRFKTKAVGTANVTFSQGSQIIRTSDTKDVLSLIDSKGGVYTLVTTLPAATAPEKKQSTPSQLPKGVGTTGPTTALFATAVLAFILGTTLLKSSAQNS